MEDIRAILEQISGILALILAVQWLAMFIVNLTPTPADNRWVGKFYKFVEVLAGVITTTAKELPGERGAGKRVKSDELPEYAGDFPVSDESADDLIDRAVLKRKSRRTAAEQGRDTWLD